MNYGENCSIADLTPTFCIEIEIPIFEDKNMRRLLCLIFAVISICMPIYGQERFEKYRRLEVYEVRPGIVAIATRGLNGQVCEIGIERLHYTPKLIRLNSEISDQEIDEILAELVPATDRGAPSPDILNDSTNLVGQSFSTTKDFEYLSIKIFGLRASGDRTKSLALDQRLAVVRWKNRQCR